MVRVPPDSMLQVSRPRISLVLACVKCVCVYVRVFFEARRALCRCHIKAAAAACARVCQSCPNASSTRLCKLSVQSPLSRQASNTLSRCGQLHNRSRLPRTPGTHQSHKSAASGCPRSQTPSIHQHTQHTSAYISIRHLARINQVRRDVRAHIHTHTLNTR